MKSTQVRKLWAEFWELKAPNERKHVWTKPASLIVNNSDDPTTMFNTAGMQPLVPYLMGKEHPGGKRVYNIQGCVRTVDIEEVGDTSHLTYFEMMGNRSLGDYFKKESVAWSREFLTQWLKLDKAKLSVTVFEGDEDAPRDEETAMFWKEQGVPEHRITYLNKKENRWGPAGATGPCGPDTEIFYWVGVGEPPVESNPGNDDENRMEIRNNVFMAYYKDKEGAFTELQDKNVDTGMGFERICMVVQAQNGAFGDRPIKDLSVYDTDIFADVLQALSRFSFQTYSETISESNDLNNKVLSSFRIVADHLRTSVVLVNEGLAPSNEGRGYVLRRIIRRMYYHLGKLCGEQQDLYTKAILGKILTTIGSELLQHYDHLKSTFDATMQTVLEELLQFQTTIKKGEKKIEELMSKKWKDGIFPGEQAFVLYDTYGLPVELTQELLAERSITVDMEGFHKAMSQAKERSRAGASKKFNKGTDRASYIEGVPQTVFVGYEENESTDSKLLKDFEVDGRRILIFDTTPFYAESGGQRGDQGRIELDDGSIVSVLDVQKYGGVRLHFVE